MIQFKNLFLWYSQLTQFISFDYYLFFQNIVHCQNYISFFSSYYFLKLQLLGNGYLNFYCTIIVPGCDRPWKSFKEEGGGDVVKSFMGSFSLSWNMPSSLPVNSVVSPCSSHAVISSSCLSHYFLKFKILFLTIKTKLMTFLSQFLFQITPPFWNAYFYCCYFCCPKNVVKILLKLVRKKGCKKLRSKRKDLVRSWWVMGLIWMGSFLWDKPGRDGSVAIWMFLLLVTCC